jgi:hypothetical protein
VSQHYTDPNRAKDSYSLPDLEIWPDYIATVDCAHCGAFELPLSGATATDKVYCPSCEREAVHSGTSETEKYWYWFCLPGCMPDSDAYGPYDSEDEALNAAQEQAGVDTDDDEDGEN